MTSVEALLWRLCPEIEGQLKPNLQGFTGMIVRGYLPQAWTFRTEREVATLYVDTQGTASVKRGRPANPDVTVASSHEPLAAALQARDRTALPRGEPVNVVPHTEKGRAAFEFLRDRFGL